MKISEGNKKILVDEFKFIVKKMQLAEKDQEKLYYFSGSFGMILRVLNLEFDPTLIFIHHVLQTSHGTLNQTLQNILSGQERVITLPDNLFEKLTQELQQLSKMIEQEKDVRPVLEKISNIAYFATGNGFYLYQKGLLKM